MRRTRLGLLWGAGVLFLVSLGAAGVAWIRPASSTALEVQDPDDDTRSWSLVAETPRAILAGGGGRARLEVTARSTRGAALGDALAADLVAPGLQAEPSGRQWAPAAGNVTFEWWLRATTPGTYEVTSTLTRQTVGGVGRLLWSKGTAVEVVAPAGLGATGVTTIGLVAGIAAFASATAGWRLWRTERRTGRA